MKNLFERMNSETKAKFQLQKSNYKATFLIIEKDLKSNELLGELKFSTIVNMYIHGVIDTYLIHEISKLFKD
jgi:hypothetical protein